MRESAEEDQALVSVRPVPTVYFRKSLLCDGRLSYLRKGELSLEPSGVLAPGLTGWCCWGEWELGSEKQGWFSVSDGEIASSPSHCRRTSNDWETQHTHTHAHTGGRVLQGSLN